MEEGRVLKLLEQLAEHLPGYRQRPGQKQMALAVQKALDEHKTLLVEGGTGVGKSVAYLLPALLSVAKTGARILIATSHKPLQDQIAKKDLPLLYKLMRSKGYREFTWVTLKGISNYVCWHSADEEQSRIALDPVADRVIRYATTAGSEFSGDFEELPFNVPQETRSLLSASSEDCLGKRCPHFSKCYAFKVREQAEEADVVVTNHALLTLDIRSEGAIIPGAFAAYIIDEGHNFEDNATKANGLALTLGACRRFINSDIIKNLAKTSSFRTDNARDNVDKLQQAVALLWAEDARKTDNEDETKRLLKMALPAGQALADSFKDLMSLVKAIPPKTDEEGARAQRLIKQGLSLVERLEKISALVDPNLVYYAERSYYGQPQGEGYRRRNDAPSGYALYAMPIDVSGYLEKWFAENTVIVTSATLSDGESFEFFKKRIGIKNTESLIVPSPFNYPEQVRLFLPRPNNNGTAPAGAQFYTALAGQIAALLNTVYNGRALVLFTSYAALDSVWRKLKFGDVELKPDRPMFRQGEAQMQRIISDFQSTHNGIIFGTRSWWQGVDLPGMRLLIIDKLPFPQLNDPVVKARIEDIDSKGGSSFNEFMLPMAIITFRQGAGRLMRQEDDHGVIVVCDERVSRQRYGQKFLKSLPANIPALKSLDEIPTFLSSFD